MKTLEELEAEIAKLQAEIEERKKPKGTFVPKNGDKVYCVTWNKPDCWVYNEDNPRYKHLADLGLLVPTIEEYNRVVAKMKAREKLLRCEGARHGFKIVEDNYYIYRDEDVFQTLNNRHYHTGEPAYFDTEDQAKASISLLTKEELDALFPVVGV